MGAKKAVYLKTNEEEKWKKKKNKVGEIFMNQNIANYSSLVRHLDFILRGKGNHRQVLCKRVMCYNLQFANTFWHLGERDSGVLGSGEDGESERVLQSPGEG